MMCGRPVLALVPLLLSSARTALTGAPGANPISKASSMASAYDRTLFF